MPIFQSASQHLNTKNPEFTTVKNNGLSIIGASRINGDREPIHQIKTDKKILDPCCGPRMFWFNKANPDVLFADIRNENYIMCDGKELKINPDVVMDFREMPFQDNTFKMVVFDPPHIQNLSPNTWMAQKYGSLTPTWRTDLKAGFDECMRVLQPEGTLIFKWNEAKVTLNEVLKIFQKQPLFGHTTGKIGKTIWVCFMKQ